MTEPAARAWPARLWPIVKWGLFLAVLYFVGRHGHRLWTEVGSSPVRLNWSWLSLAVTTSILAWLPSAWYWRKLITSLGVTPAWMPLLRAYYCGHLGKYVPGKAVAIVVRAALIRDWGVSAPAAALTVTIDAVTYMWTGALLALLLFPSLAPHLPEPIAADLADPWWRALVFTLILIGGSAGLALLMRSYNRLIRLLRAAGDAPMEMRGDVPLRTTLAGVAVFFAAWWLQGLTLGLTIQAVSSVPVHWGDWPFWTGASAVALVGGFVAVFTPGGLGVREGLLMELLERQLGPREAVIVAVVLRGVALAGEILIAGALYYTVKGGSAGVQSLPTLGNDKETSRRADKEK